MTFLYQLFGTILRAIYNLVGSYGWSIVLFAVFAKIILIPLTIKQTKSMQMMKVIQPKMTELQKKYGNNKEKLNEEMMKLYKKYNYNPMSGCLPLLIQFPIIIGLFGVLRQPDPYVFTTAEFALVSQNFLWIENLTMSTVEVFKTAGFSLTSILASIIPAISAVLTFWQQKQTSQQSGGMEQQKMMMTMMTVMVAFMGFTFSQGLAIYWALQTGLGILQNEIMTKFFPVKVPEEKKVVTRSANKK